MFREVATSSARWPIKANRKNKSIPGIEIFDAVFLISITRSLRAVTVWFIDAPVNNIG